MQNVCKLLFVIFVWGTSIQMIWEGTRVQYQGMYTVKHYGAVEQWRVTINLQYIYLYVHREMFVLSTLLEIIIETLDWHNRKVS